MVLWFTEKKQGRYLNDSMVWLAVSQIQLEAGRIGVGIMANSGIDENAC